MEAYFFQVGTLIVVVRKSFALLLVKSNFITKRDQFPTSENISSFPTSGNTGDFSEKNIAFPEG